MIGLRTISTVVLSFLGVAVLAIGVAALVYNWPGDTQGAAVIAGLVVLAVGIRAVTHLVLEQASRDDD